jgi:hypothetical protein
LGQVSRFGPTLYNFRSVDRPTLGRAGGRGRRRRSRERGPEKQEEGSRSRKSGAYRRRRTRGAAGSSREQRDLDAVDEHVPELADVLLRVVVVDRLEVDCAGRTHGAV